LEANEEASESDAQTTLADSFQCKGAKEDWNQIDGFAFWLSSLFITLVPSLLLITQSVFF